MADNSDHNPDKLTTSVSDRGEAVISVFFCSERKPVYTLHTVAPGFLISGLIFPKYDFFRHGSKHVICSFLPSWPNVRSTDHPQNNVQPDHCVSFEVLCIVFLLQQWPESISWSLPQWISTACGTVMSAIVIGLRRVKKSTVIDTTVTVDNCPHDSEFWSILFSIDQPHWAVNALICIWKSTICLIILMRHILLFKHVNIVCSLSMNCCVKVLTCISLACRGGLSGLIQCCSIN